MDTYYCETCMKDFPIEEYDNHECEEFEEINTT